MLSNQIILITGAGRGIGKALARTCAQQGAQLLLLSKTTTQLEAVSDEITADGHLPPLLIPFDFATANPTDYNHLSQEISTIYGKLHALIHCAAQQGQKTPLVHYDILKWYETLQINLNAPFLLTQSLMPLLKRAPHASVIFTTAPAGHQGMAYQGAYGVSKAALLNLMQIWAQELEENTNIRVNAVNPMAINTRLYQQNYPGAHPEIPEPQAIVPLYLSLLTQPKLAPQGACLHFHPETNIGYELC